MNGNIYIEDLLTVKSTAKIIGDIKSQKLVIESGAEFNGNSQMGVSKLSDFVHKQTNPLNVKAAVIA